MGTGTKDTGLGRHWGRAERPGHTGTNIHPIFVGRIEFTEAACREMDSPGRFGDDGVPLELFSQSSDKLIGRDFTEGRHNERERRGKPGRKGETTMVQCRAGRNRGGPGSNLSGRTNPKWGSGTGLGIKQESEFLRTLPTVHEMISPSDTLALIYRPHWSRSPCTRVQLFHGHSSWIAEIRANRAGMALQCRLLSVLGAETGPRLPPVHRRGCPHTQAGAKVRADGPAGLTSRRVAHHVAHAVDPDWPWEAGVDAMSIETSSVNETPKRRSRKHGKRPADGPLELGAESAFHSPLTLRRLSSP